jgi:hypothetical protein
MLESRFFLVFFDLGFTDDLPYRVFAVIAADFTQLVKHVESGVRTLNWRG